MKKILKGVFIVIAVIGVLMIIEYYSSYETECIGNLNRENIQKIKIGMDSLMVYNIMGKAERVYPVGGKFQCSYVISSKNSSDNYTVVFDSNWVVVDLIIVLE